MAEELNELKDRLSFDTLLIPALHPSLTVSPDPNFHGLMYEVKTQTVVDREYGSGISLKDEPRYIDLVRWYGLQHLDRIKNVKIFDAHMEDYLKRLIPTLEKEEAGPFNRSIHKVLDYIRSRFGDFRFYAGSDNMEAVRFYTGEEELMQGNPFPVGSLVLAETKAKSLTFYYFVHGLWRNYNTSVAACLRVYKNSLVPPLEEEETGWTVYVKSSSQESGEEDTSLPLRSCPDEDKDAPVFGAGGEHLLTCW